MLSSLSRQHSPIFVFLFILFDYKYKIGAEEVSDVLNNSNRRNAP